MSVELFFSSALNAVDGKNRLSIPADYRSVIENRSKNRQLFLAPSRSATCLIGYDEQQFDRLQAEHASRYGAEISRERAADARATFGAVTKFSIDEAGRIVLPPALKRTARIGASLWFIGAGHYFEAWDPYRYQADADADPILVEMLRYELEARGLPLDASA